MKMNLLIREAYNNASNHGFYEDIDGIRKAKFDIKLNDILNNNALATRLMLIVGEVSEAMEALRKKDNDNFNEELADIAIRLFDLCGYMRIDLEREIQLKMQKNKDRPYKHGKAF